VGTLAGLARFDGVNFKVFTPENCPELPKSRIGGLFQGRDGTLFIATERGGGLVALKGGRFKRLLGLRNEEDEIISCLDERSGSSLFVARSGAVWRWSGENLVAVSTNREFAPIVSQHIGQDQQGRVWMISRAGGTGRLLHLTERGLEPVAMPETLAGAQVNALTLDKQGQVWLGTAQGLAMLEGDRLQRVESPELGSDEGITDLAPSSDGGIWVYRGHRWQTRERDGRWTGAGADLSHIKTHLSVLGEDRWSSLCLGRYPEGLVRISRQGTVSRIDRQKGLPGTTVACYLVDREGNEWLGLIDGGLVRLQPRRFESMSGLLETLSMPVHSVCEDHQGAIWVGTSLGGVYRFSGTNVTRFVPPDLPLTDIWSVFEDSRSNLWVGTSSFGVFQFQEGHFVPKFDRSQLSERVNAIYEDRLGRIWFGHLNGLACYGNDQLTKAVMPWHSDESEVLAIAGDRRDRLWVGTRGAGLYCLQDGRFTSYTSTNGLPNNLAWSLYVDAEDTLWIGTADGGLSRLRDGKFATFTMRDGLADNTICHIAEDARGRLWFSSPHGVFRVEKAALEAHARGEIKTFACTSYTRADGMPSSGCTCAFQPSGCQTRDGRLLFPTAKGLAIVRADTEDANPVPPTVLIEEVVVDGQPQTLRHSAARRETKNRVALSIPSTIVVAPGRRRLEIHYTALSYSAPEKVRFKCRMGDLEPDWTDASTKRVAIYPVLPHGRYRFQVQACNNDGVWNQEGASLDLVIEPYFWQTWWFIGVTILSGAAGVAVAARGLEKAKTRRRLEREEQLRAVERERSRIARDFHDGLGASLTRMIVLSELVKADRAQPEEVAAHATKIGSTAQEVVRGLGTIIWAVNPRNDTLDSLVQYLSQYACDFFQNSSVRVRLDFPAEVPVVPLPAEMRHNLFMVVKEALHNILKHAKATKARLCLSVREGMLEIAIEDDGCGFEPTRASTPQRSGLVNMRQRAEAISASLEIASQPGQGSSIRVRVACPPLPNVEPAT
jgi:signal transduction histidine kinase/ligand-binding sensor domain-containing protein